ncbi:MAG TPA: hypothetical protein VJN72_06270 [Gaiellales bacterium]|nr:hypothetical protein [Gaiellales bacterium]
MAADALISGHVLLADWLFLIAAAIFAITAILVLVERQDPTHGFALLAGLCLATVGWLVL